MKSASANYIAGHPYTGYHAHFTHIVKRSERNIDRDPGSSICGQDPRLRYADGEGWKFGAARLLSNALAEH